VWCNQSKHYAMPSVIVIDGQNLAVGGGKACDATRSTAAVLPRISALIAAIDYFRQRSLETVAFVPAWWLTSKPGADSFMSSASSGRRGGQLSLLEDESLALRLLVEAGTVLTVPAKDHDDPYFLEYAWQKRAFVVSNDRFLDQVQGWIQRAGEREAAAAQARGLSASGVKQVTRELSMHLDEEEDSAGHSTAAATMVLLPSQYPLTPDLEEKIDWWKGHILSYVLRPLHSPASTSAASPAPFQPGFEFLPNPTKMECVVFPPGLTASSPPSPTIPSTMELLRLYYERKQHQVDHGPGTSHRHHHPRDERRDHHRHHHHHEPAPAAAAPPVAPAGPLDSTILRVDMPQAGAGAGPAYLIGPGADLGSFLSTHVVAHGHGTAAAAPPATATAVPYGGISAAGGTGGMDLEHFEAPALQANSSTGVGATTGTAGSSALAGILPKGASVMR
jgi:Zc3h12a-like Ribonuclease NYN domain